MVSNTSHLLCEKRNINKNISHQSLFLLTLLYVCESHLTSMFFLIRPFCPPFFVLGKCGHGMPNIFLACFLILCTAINSSTGKLLPRLDLPLGDLGVFMGSG